MMESEKIRQGIKDQWKGNKNLPKLENKLLKLQQKQSQMVAKGKADTYASQIADLQSQIAGATGGTYNLSGMKNPNKILRKMTDLELYRTFGPSGAYNTTAGTTGTAAGTGGVPADTSQTGLQQSALQAFQTDPGYLFRLQEAEKSILRNRAATGGAQSGATLKALDRYSQDYASKEYGNYYNRLAALAGQGQTQQSTNANEGYNTAQAVSSDTLAAGQARASSYINQGNAWTSGLNSLTSGLGNILGSSNSGGFPYKFAYNGSSY
jgi:hypothetical protein